MTRLLVLLFFLPCLVSAQPPETPDRGSARVLPFLLEQVSQWTPGDEIWLEVEYRAAPQGEVIFREQGEKIWWMRQTPMLLLGSSGLPLPKDLIGRASLWVQLHHQGEPLGTPRLVYPLRDRIAVSSDQAATRLALAKGLGMVDATYLAQVANFIAGNLAVLDVEATSYNITGYGQVINSSGEWVGEPIAGGDATYVYLMRHAETTGIGGDPDLSPEGMLRVANLQAFFTNVQIDAFFSSHLQRTIQTVEPLATERGLTVNIVANGDPTLTVQEIQARPGQTLMIAGHSNTIPVMIQMLGGPVVTIGESDYNNLYLMVLGSAGSRFQHYLLDP